MSGLKNYQRYRVEVARLSPYFYLASAGREEQGGAGAAGNGGSGGLDDDGDVGEL
jgi:hypothetical protein